MRIMVKVPKLGLTIEEVTLTSWEKETGASVSAGDVIAFLEADKAGFELVAPTTGTLTKKLAEPGGLLAVGDTVAIIEN